MSETDRRTDRNEDTTDRNEDTTDRNEDTTDRNEDTTGEFGDGTRTSVRTAGGLLALGSILFAIGLVFHPPPSPDLGQFMATIADGPDRWVAAHWASALALSTFAIAGLVVLTAGSRLTQRGSTALAWAVLIVSSLWVTTAAVAEATVVTAAAIAGDTATFEAWQTFAEAHAAAFVVLAAAVAVIAANEARSSTPATPVWASWIGALAGVVAAAGIALVLGAGVAMAGPVWLASTLVMSLWTFWFGLNLARSDGFTVPTGTDEPDVVRRKAVR